MKINVLSLFGWIECGRIALERAGFEIGEYYSSEIDPYAKMITTANYPDIRHIWDIEKVAYNDGVLKWLEESTIDKKHKVTLHHSKVTGVDLMIGWSPCQDLSIAKSNGKGLDGEKSWLFYEYVRLLREVKPKYFLLENVASMKKEYKDKITEVLREIYPDTQVYMINSALVSAQNRKRLYWTNIAGGAITQPVDKWIRLQDVLEDIPMDDEQWKPIPEKYITENFKVRIREATKLWYIEPEAWDCVDMAQENSKTRRGRLMKAWWKSNALLTGNQTMVVGIYQLPRGKNEWGIVQEWNKAPTVVAKEYQYNNFAVSQTYMWRKITPLECERLQTLPDGYTAHVSNSRRYKAIGNGWTVDVIAHILSFIPWSTTELSSIE